MKKVFLLVLMALVLTGCATRRFELPDGRVVTKREPMVQVGVILNIKNNCAPSITIQSIRGVEARNLSYGRSSTSPIPARFVAGNNNYREIWIMVSAYADEAGTQYIGSIERREQISSWRGTEDLNWQVDRLQSPPGAKCPGNGAGQ